MAAYLVDHPPARSQYVEPRRSKPSGVIVVHTAENTPDFVAFDGGAEAVANFIATRSTAGSYHDLVDSDSILSVVPYEWEAFHDGTGSNRHSLSVSIATRADVWPLAPQAWRDAAIENAAQAAARQARWVKAQTGIVVPAERITREESELLVPGFISHAQRDPTRRTDPGKDFPWSDFLSRFAELTTLEEPLKLDDEDRKWLGALMSQATGTRRKINVADRSEVWSWSRESVLLNRSLTAEVAALRDAIGQLGAGGSIDYGKVQTAAEDAVRAVLGDLDDT